MKSGKEICKSNKERRNRIAEINRLYYKSMECTFEGECTGTCPFSEAEAKLLDNMISSLKTIGEYVEEDLSKEPVLDRMAWNEVDESEFSEESSFIIEEYYKLVQDETNDEKKLTARHSEELM